MAEKKKREIKPTRAIANNIVEFLGYFEWLFYSAFFMRFVINSLVKGD